MKRLKNGLMKNPMLSFLMGLKGNARACLWPEPLWGIPYNLYLPYASLQSNLRIHNCFVSSRERYWM